MVVEFLGVPRQRAGVSRLEVQAETLGEALKRVSTQLPGMAALIEDDRLNPAVVANLNGDRFISDPLTRLAERDCVLILSSDAGG